MSKFGITIDDILSLFNGSVISDWSTGNITGEEVIEREIELVEDEALDLLDANARKQIESGLEPHIISNICPNISGDYVVNLLGTPECLEVRILDREVVISDIYNNGCYETIRCRGIDFTDLELFTDYTIEGNMLIIGGSYNGEELVIRYQAGDDFNLPSVARYVRNKVGCVLGRILYSTSGNEWELVNYLCKEAQRFEDKWSGIKKFVPPELRNLKYLNGTPFNIGIYSIASRRS